LVHESVVSSARTQVDTSTSTQMSRPIPKSTSAFVFVFGEYFLILAACS
jgi:hypothetical protein